MAEQSGTAPNRLARRKARTRTALIRAAQAFITERRPNVPILEITQAADVGMGSFYNHFEDKEQLFRAAYDEALGSYGALLDRFAEDLTDPAEAFARSFRLTGRLHRGEPEMSRVLLNGDLGPAGSDIGLAPRVRRDVEAAAATGRFTVRDPELALVIIAGAAVRLGLLLHEQPERDDAEASDQITEDLLRMLGVPADEARDIARRPWPALDDAFGSMGTTV